MTAVTEDELKAHQKDVGGKRVTLEGLEANIKTKQFIVVPGSMLTICVLTLQNGFNVTGESACADPAMFKKDIGERVSEDNAKRKIWPLMGYALKQELFLAGGGTFQDRVQVELAELTDKIVKLEAFCAGHEHYTALDGETQNDLNDQLQAMKAYQFLLQKRINRF